MREVKETDGILMYWWADGRCFVHFDRLLQGFNWFKEKSEENRLKLRLSRLEEPPLNSSNGILNENRSKLLDFGTSLMKCVCCLQHFSDPSWNRFRLPQNSLTYSTTAPLKTISLIANLIFNYFEIFLNFA